MQNKSSQKSLRLVSVFVLMLLQACSTPALRNSRRGLLDSYERSSQQKNTQLKNTELKNTEPNYQHLADENDTLRLKGEWQWPLENVEVTSDFGQRGRKSHQGVDLRASMGTPVYAASNGQVVYVGNRIRGYGRMIVLQHAHNVFTVYAHHSKNLVKLGQKVKIGQMIAKSGKSGRASGPHLHFELREGTMSYNPIAVLKNYYAAKEASPNKNTVRRSDVALQDEENHRKERSSRNLATQDKAQKNRELSRDRW